MIRFLTILLILGSSLFAKTSYALLIGVDGNNLVGASNDANKMKTILKNKGIKNITLLTNHSRTKPNKQNIISAFKKIANRAKAHDTVYLFFSGHGTNKNDQGIGKKLQNKLGNTGGLLPYGTKGINYNSLVVIKRDLVKYFKKLDRKKVKTVIIFDACFTGSSYKEFHSNSKGNLSIYAKPTRTSSNYPYKNIVYLGASTTLARASESSSKKRGYFSMAVGSCLKKNNRLNALRSCVNKKYKFKATILPKRKNSILFSKSNKKEIMVRGRLQNLKKKLFNLANNQQGFELYAQNKNHQQTKEYSDGEQLFIYLNSQKSGYFVLFMMGTSHELHLSYPNSKKMPYIKSNTHKKLFSIRGKEPFGKEPFGKEPFGKELIGAFLVDKTSSKSLQNLYLKTNGKLEKKKHIQEAINIIKQGETVSYKLLLNSHKK